MSQHPSLRAANKSRQHRSVLKRFERIKLLMADERWKEGDSVFGLPKVKTLKVKAGKAKTAQVQESAQAETSSGAGGTSAGAQAKSQDKPKEKKTG